MTLSYRIWHDDSHLEIKLIEKSHLLISISFKMAVINVVLIQCSVLLSCCQKHDLPKLLNNMRKMHKIDYCLYIFQYTDLV